MSPNTGASRSASMDNALMRRRRQDEDRCQGPRRLPVLPDGPVELPGEGVLIGQEVVVGTVALAMPVSETVFSTPTQIVEERLERSVPRMSQSLGPPFSERQVAEMERLQRQSTLLPTSREVSAQRL